MSVPSELDSSSLAVEPEPSGSVVTPWVWTVGSIAVVEPGSSVVGEPDVPPELEAIATPPLAEVLDRGQRGGEPRHQLEGPLQEVVLEQRVVDGPRDGVGDRGVGGRRIEGPGRFREGAVEDLLPGRLRRIGIVRARGEHEREHEAQPDPDAAAPSPHALHALLDRAMPPRHPQWTRTPQFCSVFRSRSDSSGFVGGREKISHTHRAVRASASSARRWPRATALSSSPRPTRRFRRWNWRGSSTLATSC